MSVEFVDTNVLIYGHDGKAGLKRAKSIELVRELAKANSGALSIQVLSEFYAAATKMKIDKVEAEGSEIWAGHSWRYAMRPAR